MGFRVSGLSELEKAMEGLANLDTAVKDRMLIAGADIAVVAQKRKAESMLKGPHSSNPRIVANAIVRKKPKDGQSIRIVFDGNSGKNVKYSIGYIAFVNEFGKTNQPARPFIRDANEESADAIAEAEARVFHEHLDNLGL